jgi:SulP family sulfate permease
MFACSIFVLFILLVAFPVINVLPVAALTGVMFNVVVKTMVWSSLKLLVVAVLPLRLRNRCLRAEGSRAKKVPRADAFVILVVTIMTLLTDLAKAVILGVVISVFMYVYESAEFISVKPREGCSADETKIYEVHGVLFFGSASRFLECFNVEKDPERVRLVFETSYVSDYSALEALNKLGERYHACGKHLTIELLHPNNSKIIDKAQKLLGKEIGVEIDGAPVLPLVCESHVVEGYGPTSSFLLSRAADAAAAIPVRFRGPDRRSTV